MAEQSVRAREAIGVALAASRETDLIEGVKAAVIGELESLDPSVSIKSTPYFNHSYAPDLELTWPDDRRHGRYVYLRYSLGSAAASEDFQALGSLDPVVLGLREDEPEGLELARQDLQRTDVASSGVLVTNVGALDDFGDQDRPAAIAPLLALVRGNLVRGARGLIVADGARQLASQAASTDLADPTEQVAQLQRFEQVVAQSFLSDAATRLTRAAQLVRASLDEGALLRAGDDDEEQGISGTLSVTELKILLPYFLRSGAPPRSAAFWQHLGGLLTLDGLEGLWDVLVDTDLSPLVRPNTGTWQAKRAQVALATEVFEEPRATEPTGETNDPSAAVQPGWRFQGRRLCLSTQAWKVFFTTDKRALSGRQDSTSARWENLEQLLSRFDLAAVRLYGITRRLEVAAENAADVYRDVTSIRALLDDDYHVPAVTVRPKREEAAAIRADFTTMLAEPIHGAASLQDLAEVALVVLGHRRPVDEDALNNLL